jgi:DNA-binding CsgD family transcriptional regulator
MERGPSVRGTVACGGDKVDLPRAIAHTARAPSPAPLRRGRVLGVPAGRDDTAFVSAGSGWPVAVTPPLLFERDAELQVITDLVRGVEHGAGAVVLVEAPAGLGKSVLLDHAAAGASGAGLLVLRARGHQLERGFGWGIARSLFEGLLQGGTFGPSGLLDGPAAPARAVFLDDQDAPGRLGSDEAAFGMLHALYWLVVRLGERRPLLLVVDDAHWADVPSLRFLAHLQPRIAELPVGVVVGARPPGPDVDGVLGVVAAHPGTRVLRLPSLTGRAVEELVRGRWPAAPADVCRRCLELTAGNPLQLGELLRAADAVGGLLDLGGLGDAAMAAARSLERSVLNRLAVLAPPAGALAEAVAVFEDDVPLHLAAVLAQVDLAAAGAAVDELIRADVLAPRDPLGFRHPLLRAAVYGALPAWRRAQTHARAARLLITSGAGVEQVCAHLLLSTPRGDAAVVDTLRSAAWRARATAAPGSAIQYLERALREPPPAHARTAVLAELGYAEAVTGRAEAVEHLESAIASAENAGQRAELQLAFGRALHHGGRLVEACEAFRRGLAELPDAAVEHGELRIELEAGYLNSALFTPERARDAHQRAPQILARRAALAGPGELALLSKALMLRLWAAEDREEVLGAARRLVDDGRLRVDDAADSQVAWQTIASLSWADDYSTASRGLRAAFDDARCRGSVLAFALAGVLSARQMLWTGPVDEAVHDARTALDALPDGSIYRSSAAYCVVSGLLEQGQVEKAAAVLQLLAAGGLADPPFFAAWRLMAEGRLAAHRGDDTRAVEAFLAVGRMHAALLIVNPAVLPWRSEAALAAQRLGQRDRADALVAEEGSIAERFGAPRALGVARRAFGLLARGDDAIDLLRSAADVLGDCGARVEHARALGDLGAAVRRRGHPAQARPILRDALALAEAIGAIAVAEAARTELRVAGGRAPRRAMAPVDRLTPGERRVAELAATGRSNRQISNALFITVKAVEWHLGNAYRKLDVRGRSGLPSALGIPGVQP